MTDKLVSNIPENTNPNDADFIYGSTSISPQSWQRTKVIDLVKARYNPASGWVLKDGSASPYNANAGDKLIVDSATTGFEINLSGTPSFGDELHIINLGNDFNLVSATPNSFLVTGIKLYQIVFYIDWKITELSTLVNSLV